MNKSKYEHEWWQFTWNPISGCSPISDGCKNCYAAAISKRFGLPWGRPVFHPERLDEPQRVKKPSLVFVCSMSDLGHERVLDDWQSRILDAMKEAPWHTYAILTKRPGEWMHQFSNRAWLGITTETQRDCILRLQTVAYLSLSRLKLFISAEPMLTSINPNPKRDFMQTRLPTPGWVICGPETGPKARPCKAEWVDELAAQSACFFDKRKVGFGRRERPT